MTSSTRVRRRSVAALAAAAIMAGLMVSTSAGAGSVAVNQTVTNQWSSGYQAAMTIRNDSGAALKKWRLEFDLPHPVSSIWDAVLVSQVANHVVIDGPAWQRDVASGATAGFGYVAGLSGARQNPTNCRINGMACSFGGATPPTTTVPPTTTAPPSTTVPPTTSTTTTVPPTTSTTTTVPPTTSTTVPPPSGGVSLSYRTTDRWNSGYNAQIDVANGGPSMVTGWTLKFKLSGATVSDMWNATYTRAADGTYTVRNENWNGNIGPGQTVGVGFGASGTPATPTNCSFNGVPCTFGGPPITTTTTTASPTTTTTVPPGGTTTTTVPGGGGGGSVRFPFAPYADSTLWPTIDLPAMASATGVKTYTLAFIVNGQGSCRASWGTYYVLEDNWMADQVAALRAMGGDVIVSFGGAANQELALTCPSVDALAAQYQAVIDRYGLTSIDFDVEGSATTDAVSVDRRSKAIAKVQQQARAAGRQLQVSLTLPVLPTGLVQSGIDVVRSARDNGVDLSVVNVMAMDYGVSQSSPMGSYAIQAATSTRDQLRTLYPSRTDAQLWAMVGVTPMIGQNDIGGEVFTTADARQLTDFARQNHLGRMAMWSANRDSQCASGVKTNVDNLCSGVIQAPYEFSNTFKQFTG